MHPKVEPNAFDIFKYFCVKTKMNIRQMCQKYQTCLYFTSPVEKQIVTKDEINDPVKQEIYQ